MGGDATNMTGSYQTITDSDALVTVKADVASIHSEIIALLQQNQLEIENGAVIHVTAAQSQVVAGTNYKVTMDVGSYGDVVIGYFVALPVNGVTQTPSNVHLID